MSVQFGIWNFDGQSPAQDYIERVRTTLAPYGPDSDGSYAEGGVTILYRGFHTTKESRDETQPAVSRSGTTITWDGRLDNRSELVTELRNGLATHSTDVAIVAAAYEEWGDKCFSKLIGDWALSIWNPIQRSLILAKDVVGTCHLYYSFDHDRVTWCTILDPLVRFAGKKFAICEEYIAGWLTSQFSAPHITPYVGVQAVPPSCSVLLRPGRHGTKHTITKYWDFDPGNSIRYRTDAEYEEQFRSVFATAVQRRLRSDRPVLAELSGGMDSASIVCMADLIMGVSAQARARRSPAATSALQCPRLDTISWFGDSYEELEPDTNEFHWISKVEQTRGRAGFHINFDRLAPIETGALKRLISSFDSGGFACAPAPKTLSRLYQCYAAHIASGGYKVTISGVGGDGVTGKELTPVPELQNFVARGHIFSLARQLDAWASETQRPRRSLLWEAIREFFPRRNQPTDVLSAPWFRSEFIHRNHVTLCGRPARVRLLGHLPSFQHNLHDLDAERRLAACWDPTPNLVREVRYPYLDRDFLSFMYAIPREKVVRAGAHRFLMKRALVGIVPDELLHRKRKPFVPPQPEIDKEKHRSTQTLAFVEIGQYLVSSSLGITDQDRFTEALQRVGLEEEASMHMLKRSLRLEFWLRHLSSHQILGTPKATDRQADSLKAREVSLARQKSSAS
jgi:asparagine synthase (glutamine-hydrolysing)